MAFADWMVNVGGSTTPGQIVIHGAEHSVDSTNPGAQQLDLPATDADKSKPMVQYFSFNTPVEVAPEQQCGRVVMSDLHVSAGTPSDSGKLPFPSGCMTTDADAAGEGAGVHAVRPVVVRDPRRQAAVHPRRRLHRPRLLTSDPLPRAAGRG